MIFWLPIIVLAYLFFSLASLGDKLVLAGLPQPKLYTFYVGVLSVLVVFLIPFTSFGLPSPTATVWIILEAVVYILGLYAMFLALEKFEVSRVMTAIGAIQPVFILILTLVFWGAQIITVMNFLAFMLLLLGSIIISFEKKFKITGEFLLLVLFSAAMFSLDYIFSKFVFLHQPFLQGLIWMRIASALLVLLFLFDKKLRAQIFTKKAALNKKTGLLFLFSQSSGGIANILQSFAISLVPVSYLAIINSLRGIQYIFLFLITLFFPLFFPKILKEEISKNIIIQKLASIILIALGLGLLVI